MKMVSLELLDNTIAEVQNQLDVIQSSIANLPEDRLNRRPADGKWNILECIEHLNRYGNFYIEQFKKVAVNGKDNKQDTFKSGFLGNYFVRSMLPKQGTVANKMSTFKDKNPLGNELDKQVIEKHIQLQKEFINVLEMLKAKDLNSNKVPTTLGNWLKIKLGDGIRFYTAHMSRHYIQIGKLI